MNEKNASNPVTGAVMVVGGGIAGVQSALDLADSGYYVYLVEKSPSIGGVMAQLDKTFPTNDCSMCILSPKLVEGGRHLNVQLITMADVQAIEGDAGNFTVTVQERPRYIDMDKCIACGVCAEKCPKKVEDAFNEGLGPRKAAYVKYPQAVPLKYVIDADNCIYFKSGKCKACEKFCPASAVNFNQKPKTHTLQVGSVILAPGFQPFAPQVYDTYGYGKFPNVITSMQFERILSASGPFEGHLERPSDRKAPKKIAWLQCVGSRDIHHGAHGYCSGVCCMYAIKEAVIAKEHSKEGLDTAIFFMDMRTYGKEFERYYDRAKNEAGVRFIRSRIHSIEAAAPGSDDLLLGYVDQNGKLQSEVFDMVVLSIGLEVSNDVRQLADSLQIKLDDSGFSEMSSFAPVAWEARQASACAPSRSALPPSRIRTFFFSRRIRATLRTACGSACGVAIGGSGAATTPPSSQQVSEGRIMVATWPGEFIAACTAAAASAPTSAALVEVRTHCETPRAKPSVSAVSGAS